MVHRCCISSCGMSIRIAEAKGLSYHAFPLKEPNRGNWIQAILPHIDKPDAFKVVQGYTRVCSKHFIKKDYSMDSKKRARLSSNAVPSVFPEKNTNITKTENPTRTGAKQKRKSNNAKSTSNSIQSSQDSVYKLDKTDTSNATDIYADLIFSGACLSLEDSTTTTTTIGPIIHEHKRKNSENSSIPTIPSESESELQNLSDDLHDIYADLVFGGASLSLEDSELTTFDSQDLLEALRSAENATPSSDTGQQQLTPLEYEGHNIHSGDLGLESLTIKIPEISNSTCTSIDYQNPSLFDEIKLISSGTKRASTAELNECEPAKEVKVELILKPDSPSPIPSKTKLSEESNTCSKGNPNPITTTTTVSSPSAKSSKKHGKKEKPAAMFSVDRFKESGSDIQYYTGFQSYDHFELFYRSLESYVENLKVTEPMHGVTSISSKNSGSGTDNSSTSAERETRDESQSNNTNTNNNLVQEEQKRRLSQGRAMSRIDELFLTIIRLKRKIPEKVLGDMFGTSQPTVSRIIRAWTVMLSKVIDIIISSKVTGGTANTSNSNKNDSGSSISKKLDNCSSCQKSTNSNNTEGSDNSSSSSSSSDCLCQKDLVIPHSFKQLFRTEFVQSIIASSSATNSRKTTSSTSCPNILLSKRPKKEKLSSVQ